MVHVPLQKLLTTEQNKTYAQIIQQDIFGPLDMGRSVYTLPAQLKSDVVIPNDTISAFSVDIDFAVFNGYTSVRMK
jgi:CubicO group peptidase (beta-lactamase class C family)